MADPPSTCLFPTRRSSDLDGLTLATRAGYAVDKTRVTNGRNKLMQMIGTGKSDDGQPIDPDNRAYMIYALTERDRKSTRLNSSHTVISYAVFCLKKTYSV